MYDNGDVGFGRQLQEFGFRCLGDVYDPFFVYCESLDVRIVVGVAIVRNVSAASGLRVHFQLRYRG